MEPTAHFRQLFRAIAYDEDDSSYDPQPELQQLWKDPTTGKQEWRAVPDVFEDEEANSDIAGHELPDRLATQSPLLDHEVVLDLALVEPSDRIPQR